MNMTQRKKKKDEVQTTRNGKRNLDLQESPFSSVLSFASKRLAPVRAIITFSYRRK
jgi:hypothetical protein